MNHKVKITRSTQTFSLRPMRLLIKETENNIKKYSATKYHITNNGSEFEGRMAYGLHCAVRRNSNVFEGPFYASNQFADS